MKAYAWTALVFALLGCERGEGISTEEAGAPRTTIRWRAVTVAEGVRRPWGLAWLPDGGALVTSRDNGTLHLFDGKGFQDVAMEGMPEICHGGQGGLMDIAFHPEDVGDSRRVYMTLSTGSQKANRVVLVRGRFDGKRVHGIEEIFRVVPDKSGSQHFGSRLLWLDDNTLLMSVGDGGNPPLRIGGMLAREQAQNLKSHLGSILRLDQDGRPAPGNPFLEREDALPEIWSYGHRNIQGLTRDPVTGRVWANEHGPRGGDELNLIEKGRNYGWPLQTHGRDYRTGFAIGSKSVEGMVDPRVVWTPAHAPSGLALSSGERVPGWRGNLFSGGLASQEIRRIELDDEGRVLRQERMAIGSRVREVSQGPDGHIYALTDGEDGRLIRIEPE